MVGMRSGPLVKTAWAAIRAFPWFSRRHAFVIARVGTAGLFLAHAVVRIVNDTLPQFAHYMASCGFPYPLAVVWAITIAELVASAMLILGCYVRWAAAVLMVIVGEGIVLIHRHIGWFVGEHGVGGSEYSVALLILLMLIAVEDADSAQSPK